MKTETTTIPPARDTAPCPPPCECASTNDFCPDCNRCGVCCPGPCPHSLFNVEAEPIYGDGGLS